MGLMKNVVLNLSGVIAALPTPFGVEGRSNAVALEPIVEFLIDAGVDGLCVGGATGEYPACSVEERAFLLLGVAKRANGRVTVIAGVGAGNSDQVAFLAKAAADCGANALLFPPPFYYRYHPCDVLEFIGEVSSELPLPVILYNIPQFTNPFSLPDALQLIGRTPNIVGIKDSSGWRENLPLLGEARATMPIIYFNGDDALFLDALGHGADGAISGVASACPELLVAIAKAHRAGHEERLKVLQKFLDDFIAHIAAFPTPWGIKLALEERGFLMGPLSWPAGGELKSRMAAFRHWFSDWIPYCLEVCTSSPSQAKLG